MKYVLWLFCFCVLPAKDALSQNKNTGTWSKQQNKFNMDILTNPAVKAAIEALDSNNEKAWLDLFTADATLYDDGNTQDFKKWSNSAFKGKEHFTSIDRVEDDGLSIYGKYHSDQWGDFKTYYKFHLNKDGKFTRLDVGQD